MKFCNRCGEPVFGERCRCGGRGCEAEGSAGDMSNSPRRDIWSQKYLAHGFENVPSRLRRTSEPNATPKCQTCDARMSPTVDGGFACRRCLYQPMSKGECVACHRPVLVGATRLAGASPTWVEYGSKIWHKDCFRCRLCHIKLTTPMVDLTGKPCCEDCLMAQAGARSTMPSSIDPSLTGQDEHATHHNETTDTAAHIANKEDTPESPMSGSAATDQHKNSSDTPVSASTDQKAVTSSESKEDASGASRGSTQQSGSDTRYACQACQKPITDAGVRLPSGKLYHTYCFTCATCGKEFKERAFINYGGRPYHPDCVPKSKVENCAACRKAITGFYVKNNGLNYHAECFKCTGCAMVIGPQTPFGEIAEQPYCEACLKTRITGDIFVPPSPTTTSPSTLADDTTQKPSPSPDTTAISDTLTTPMMTADTVDADPITQLETSMDDLTLDGAWHSTTKEAAKVEFTKPEPSPQSTPVGSPQLTATSSPVPVPTNAVIGRAYGRAQARHSNNSSPSTSPLSSSHEWLLRGSSYSATRAAGVVDGAHAAAHIRSSSLSSHPTSSLQTSPHTSRPTSPRPAFEAALLSPNATSEFALSRSSSRASSVSGWEPRSAGLLSRAQSNATSNNVNGRSTPIANRFSRLGGTNRCYKCNEPLYMFEEVPGPRATKWHRRCLVCKLCKKELDSMALMRDDTDGPYCRLCFTKKGRRITMV